MILSSIMNEPGRYLFWCPGCKTGHSFWSPKWKWDGDMEKPTVTPSILVRFTRGEPPIKMICHMFVEKGKIKFLDDCTHSLKGQTVLMEDIPGSEMP